MSKTPKKLKTENTHTAPLLSSSFEIPSREVILALLRIKVEGLSFSQLIKQLKVKKKEQEAFLKRLEAMCRDQQIMKIPDNELYQINLNAQFISGKVQAHREGFGFVISDEKERDDLFLPYAEMQKVMHNDRVLVSIAGHDRKGRAEAHIVEIIERVNKKIVGRLVKEENLLLLAPEDQRVLHDIVIIENQLKAKVGEVVVVELIQFPSRYAKATARVIEILGDSDDSGIEIEIALRRFDLPHIFSAKALEQAEAMPESVSKKDLKGRIDLRDVPFVTIDGEDAKDFDDAVFAQPIIENQHQGGFRLLVAIADVSHYVKPNDPLDQDALQRATSVYFPRRVIPMLPEKLSNGLCSLNPHVDRCVLVSDMVIDSTGVLQAYQFYPAVIHSAARLTYTKVAQCIADWQGDEAKELKEIALHLKNLYAVYQSLLEARHRRGAIDFETTETQMIIDDNGKIKEILPRHRNQAHRLIEECMLVANVSAADFIKRNKRLGLYRVHDRPSEEKLQQLREFLSGLGLMLSGGETPQASDYSKLVEKVKDRPDAQIIQMMLLRSMRQAVYSPDNLGHFGLSYEFYTHFTSPIRRYPDLLTHRVIYSILNHEQYQPKLQHLQRNIKLPNSQSSQDKDVSAKSNAHDVWEILGAHCSANERRADEASRDVESWLKCYFMQSHLGAEYDGMITSVTSFGLFVQLNDLYVEGLVHITELNDDYYQFDETKHELIGERTGRRYRLFKPLKVRVARVDLEARKIDFSLTSAPDQITTKKQKDSTKRLKTTQLGASTKSKKDQSHSKRNSFDKVKKTSGKSKQSSKKS